MSDFSSQKYWETRYKNGGTSGLGSQGDLLEFKAKVINYFINKRGVCSVIDFGCGDGQLSCRIKCDDYVGYDVSPTAVEQCKKMNCPGKMFHLLGHYNGGVADLVLSIDVIFHLVEDEVFEQYMQTLFSAAEHFVIVYSSNRTENHGMARHVRHRRFSDWVIEHRRDWTLFAHTKNDFSYFDGDPNGSFCDFFFYEKGGKK